MKRDTIFFVENETVFQFELRPAGSVSGLVQLLTAAGYSNTRARRAVLEALVAATGPCNPGEILRVGRRYHAALGLVTVYRTLEMLQGLGLVRRLHLEDGCHSYVLSTGDADAARSSDVNANSDGGSASHGHHVICETCGRAVEFEGCDVVSVVAVVEARTGFKVRNHWLEMFGLCPACRAQEGA